MRFDLRHGDSREVLRTLDAASVDALVTDPPAGIGFMGKDWDTYGRSNPRAQDARTDAYDRVGKGASPYGYSSTNRVAGERGRFIAAMQPIFEECLRVLKPGAHGLVWALPRTSHWTATALEDAGFEIRDVGVHLFGTGFPKSLNIGDGRGTALKPAAEHWILVRKPLDGTVAANVAANGTGALNIDACRLGVSDADREALASAGGWARKGYETPERVTSILTGTIVEGKHKDADYHPAGRWPANVTLDEEAAALLDAQSGELQGRANTGPSVNTIQDSGRATFMRGVVRDSGSAYNYDLGGGASRFFATFKADNTCPLCGSASGAGETSRRNVTDGASAESLVAEASTQAQARDCPAPSTSATPNGSRPRSDPPTGTMPLFGNESSPESPHARHSPSGNHANGAEAHEPIGITTTTASRSRSAGSAAVAISPATPRSAEDGAGLPGESTRFLYTPKPDRGERDIGCEDLPSVSGAERTGRKEGSAGINGGGQPGRTGGARNIHPTVKSVDLMRWLCRLVTPRGGLVLDPFMGSGSTGIACAREGMRFIGIERERAYFEIARRRIVGDAPLLNRIGQLQLEGPDKDDAA